MPHAPAVDRITMSRKGAFLDLNGTLVLPLKPERLAELAPISGAIDAVARLTSADFVCPVITVQSRIAKGTFSLPDFLAWFDRFAEVAKRRGAALSGPYICPHRYAEPCPCKKPHRMLYDRACVDLQIDPTQSFVIGDSPEDMRAATRLGASGCMVRTGWAADADVVASISAEAAFVGPSIVEAVDWIVARAAEFPHENHDTR